MTTVKTILSNNSFQSFLLALIIWLGTFLKDNASFTWQGFLYAFITFVGSYFTTALAKTQTVEKVESGKIVVASATVDPAINIVKPS